MKYCWKRICSVELDQKQRITGVLYDICSEKLVKFTKKQLRWRPF